jgi:hypothetical protein
MTHEAIGSAYETLLTKENKQSFLTAFSFHCGLFPLVSNATNVALSDLIDQHFSISTSETAKVQINYGLTHQVHRRSWH